MKYEPHHPANRWLYGDFVEVVFTGPIGEPAPHPKDCACIGCIPKQPNDEVYAKLKADPWNKY